MILDKIVEDKKIRLKEHKEKFSFEEARREAEKRIKDDSLTGAKETFYDALSKPGLSIIGEFKKASPSLGNIEKTMELDERIAEYTKSVEAISCLTEEDHFYGNTEYFKEIKKMTNLPMIRKDFMIDEYQFYEAKAIGANAILLIAAILDKEQMKAFYQLTRELEMDALIETHNEKEVEDALYTGGRIIGVNNRDLKDFTIRLETTKNLRKYIPDDKCFVTESGITDDESIKYLKECKVDACLIGRAFMETADPAALAKKWKEI
ncbi:MAG: indole-3-glycerol phosphate synthase TrpC [Eubacterium sp.]|nr:indole-3-glycerol phosphate synthase TrpC [Eubacterium sp.]